MLLRKPFRDSLPAKQSNTNVARAVTSQSVPIKPLIVRYIFIEASNKIFNIIGLHPKAIELFLFREDEQYKEDLLRQVIAEIIHVIC